MRSFNIIPNKNAQHPAFYVQWFESILGPIYKDTLALVDYINHFVTPYEQKDYNTSGIHDNDTCANWDRLAVSESTPSEKNILMYTKEQQGLYVEGVHGTSPDEVSGLGLLLYKLNFREYITNCDRTNYLFYGAEADRNSNIGYYMAINRNTPIDSVDFHHKFYDKSDYLFIPFSNGAYYILQPWAMHNEAETTAGLQFTYLDEATQTLGSEVILNMSPFVQRYISFTDIDRGNRGAVLYNRKLTKEIDFNIKDQFNDPWDSMSRTLLHQEYYKNDNGSLEEIATDTHVRIEIAKLLNSNVLVYNIIAKDEALPNVHIEVY